MQNWGALRVRDPLLSGSPPTWVWLDSGPHPSQQQATVSQPQALALVEAGRPACSGRSHVHSQDRMKIGSGLQCQAGAHLPFFPGVGLATPRKEGP